VWKYFDRVLYNIYQKNHWLEWLLMYSIQGIILMITVLIFLYKDLTEIHKTQIPSDII